MQQSNQLQFQDYKTGWFTTHTRCVVGKEMINWVIEKVELDYSKASKICQLMLDQKLIENVEGKLTFDMNEYYRFYFDREDLAAN